LRVAEISRRREIVRRGPARAWTPEQLAALAEIAAQDVEQAQQAWRRDASARYVDLLDAVMVDPLAE
jgi:hypothetical protein